MFEATLHSPIHQTAHIDACKTQRIAFTTVSLGMNPRSSKYTRQQKLKS